MVRDSVDAYMEQVRKKENLKSDAMDTIEMLLREKEITSYNLEEYHDEHTDSYVLTVHFR